MEASCISGLEPLGSKRPAPPETAIARDLLVARLTCPLRRQEVVPPLCIVVRIVRPDHPMHDVAPALLKRPGVPTADRPAFLRRVAFPALVPPLIIGELAFGIGLLANLQIPLAGRRWRVIALRRNLRTPPTLEAEIHIVECGLQVGRVLSDCDPVEPRCEALLGESIFTNYSLFLHVLDHRIPSVG